MKFFNQRSLILGVVGIATLALSACASIPTSSKLPVKTVSTGSGAIVSARTFESADRLYVSGQVKPHRLNPSIHAHVDIQLIDVHGKVIAEKRDDIDAVNPLSYRARNGKSAYVASFPIGEVRQAKWIRVIYHDERHS